MRTAEFRIIDRSDVCTGGHRSSLIDSKSTGIVGRPADLSCVELVRLTQAYQLAVDRCATLTLERHRLKEITGLGTERIEDIVEAARRCKEQAHQALLDYTRSTRCLEPSVGSAINLVADVMLSVRAFSNHRPPASTLSKHAKSALAGRGSCVKARRRREGSRGVMSQLGQFDNSGTASHAAIVATLRRVPSVFERLIFAAALAGPGGPQHCRSALRGRHVALFETWLGMTVAQKLKSLAACAEGWGQPLAEVLDQWSQPRCYACLIPDCARAAQRGLFAVEMDLVALTVILAEGQARPGGMN
jgi:hypothetical protein